MDNQLQALSSHTLQGPSPLPETIASGKNYSQLGSTMLVHMHTHTHRMGPILEPNCLKTAGSPTYSCKFHSHVPGCAILLA